MENEFYVRYVRMFPNNKMCLLDKYKIYRCRELGKYIYGIYAPSLEIKMYEITSKQLNYYFERVK